MTGRKRRKRQTEHARKLAMKTGDISKWWKMRQEDNEHRQDSHLFKLQ
jgi:hypothetical protein